MANLYGVQNGVGNAFFMNTIGAVNVPCTHDVWTPIMTSGNVIAPSPGYFFVAFWANLSVAVGAGVPINMNLSCQIGAGALTNNTSSVATYTPSTNVVYSGFTMTATSQVAWMGAGSTVSINFQPATNNATVQFAGSWALALLIRGVDQ